ncbi:fibulin-1-like isoform X1 [Asterias rubens]|uniref:fibulin-1-like isoform X1 n=1 Tax=Asterias rubens TaxID=7604 RepID=UPI001454F363|nr:fibulin-1-like isoform X1 [Asterias rubens]
MWKEVILMLAISMATANAILMHQYITRCCDEGAAYLNDSNNNCSGVAAGSSDTMSRLQDEADRKDCRTSMQSCCQKRICSDGIQHRSNVGSCDRMKENTCSGSPKKTCCDCCALGIRAHTEDAPCDGLGLGVECDYAFRECCLRAGEVNERNECNIAKANGLTLCTSKCVNLIGSYVCECPVGYILSTSDNMTCIRERQDLTSICDDSFCQHNCQPYGNSYVCSCYEGYQLQRDGFSCRAPTSPSVACMFADCEYGCRPVGINSHECYCDQGYDLDSDRSTCIDLNECETVGDICPRGQTCTNTVGSYVCHAATCSTGMIFDPETSRCEDINECLEDNVCPPHKLCQNYAGGFYCQGTRCTEGQYVDKLTRECGDVDECAAGLHDCEDGFRCDNSPGSFRCIRISPCGTGYTINANLQTCEDIDECRLDTDNCPPEFYCQNTVGSYKCKRCTEGFRADASDGCALDIDECEEQLDNCPFGQQCTNNYGGYTCAPSCPQGMQYDEVYRECKDVNECVLGSHDCSLNQVCQNVEGSYQCTCRTGFEMDPYSRACVDLNECEKGTHNCRINEQCFNFMGSFTCQQRCQINYRYNSSVGCVDINECEDPQYPCRGNSQCVNLPGSFRCQPCPRGQLANLEERRCDDVNECDSNPPRCLGFCKNTFGSYRCECPKGYELISRSTCRNINECARNIHNCSSQSACFDTRGGFKCKYIQCPQYYRKEILAGDIRCRKVDLCPNNDMNCINELVKLITYIKFALPSMKDRRETPIELLNLQVANVKREQVNRIEFQLTQGNELGMFSVEKSQTADSRYAPNSYFNVVGTVYLLSSVQGPFETDLRLEIRQYNQAYDIVNINVAIISIDVGAHWF